MITKYHQHQQYIAKFLHETKFDWKVKVGKLDISNSQLNILLRISRRKNLKTNQKLQGNPGTN